MQKEVMWLCFLVIFLVGKSSQVLAQNNDKSEERVQLIKGITKFRERLFAQQGESVKNLGVVIQKINDLKPTEREIESLLSSLYRASSNYDVTGVVSSQMADRLKSNRLIKHFSYSDMDVLFSCIEVLECIYIGLLEFEYPFKINMHSEFIKELMAYELSDGMRVGEIGAGFGLFSKIISSIYRNMDLYVNELSEFSFNKFSTDFRQNKGLMHPDNRVFCLLGTKKKSRMKGEMLDKIIIRKTLHHFSREDKMLRSIAASLNEDGEVYFFETPLDSNGKSSICSNAWSDEKIRKIINTNGLEFVRAIPIDTSHVIYISRKKRT